MEYVVATCNPTYLESFLNAVDDLFRTSLTKRLSGDRYDIISITGNDRLLQVVLRCQFDYITKEQVMDISRAHSPL